MEIMQGPDFGAPKDLTPARKAFLDNTYLTQEYILPPEVREKMTQVAAELTDRYPQFGFLTVVGGLANGSHVLRRLENSKKRNPASDLDFYLGGHEVNPADLQSMAAVVQRGARDIGFESDAMLNGQRTDSYLNLDRVDAHIKNDDLNLLVLPFRASFGNVNEAKRIVLEKVLARPDKQEIWDKIAEWHIQSLSLHHGSLNIPLSNYILNAYYPQKIERFQLAETPEEALALLAMT